MLRSLFLRLAMVCPAFVAACFPCLADDVQHFETYVTADCSGRAAALASSTVWSFFDAIDQPGFRLKVDGFASVTGETNANVFSSAFMAAGLTTLGDAMVGYQLTWKDIWIKLYAGAAYQAQAQVFWDAGQLLQQQTYGAAAAVETYWKGSSGFWVSANLSWLQFDNTVSFYDRVAYQVLHDFHGLAMSVGAETGAMVRNADIYKEGRRLDIYNEYLREGALLNFRYGSHDLTLSGGFAQASDGSAPQPYATISYGKKF